MVERKVSCRKVASSFRCQLNAQGRAGTHGPFSQLERQKITQRCPVKYLQSYHNSLFCCVCRAIVMIVGYCGGCNVEFSVVLVKCARGANPFYFASNDGDISQVVVQ
jgi:hypothetical protein